MNPLWEKLHQNAKGGAIVEHIDTGSLMFLPGSQISDKPIKDISHLMNEPQKFAVIKLTKLEETAVFLEEKLFPHLKKRTKQKLLKNIRWRHY